MGMLAIGNGEKCPFCDVMLADKDLRMPNTEDTIEHITTNHAKEVLNKLFADKVKD